MTNEKEKIAKQMLDAGKELQKRVEKMPETKKYYEFSRMGFAVATMLKLAELYRDASVEDLLEANKNKLFARTYDLCAAYAKGTNITFEKEAEDDKQGK